MKVIKYQIVKCKYETKTPYHIEFLVKHWSMCSPTWMNVCKSGAVYCLKKSPGFFADKEKAIMIADKMVANYKKIGVLEYDDGSDDKIIVCTKAVD